MNTIIRPLQTPDHKNTGRASNADCVPTRKPHYDCQEKDNALQVVIYVPGVDSSGVEITTRGPDLLVTARKTHFVRVNFNALNLEGVQQDYRLSLRLGRGLDYTALEAEIHDGVLTLRIPKKQAVAFPARGELSRVA